MSSVSISTLKDMKVRREKISVITAYDATFARIVEKAGIDVILVGDSLGNVLQGQKTTLPVTNADMAYHTSCVSRTAHKSLIVTDMPFMTYGDEMSALNNAAELMRAGAHVVKIEGGAWLSNTIIKLTQNGIPVCGHLGLTPQSVNQLGGFKVQGRLPEQAKAMLEDAKALASAGACMIVLECVPSALAKLISESINIPTIGIGAGVDTDGQVLVLHDMLGLNEKPARFVKNFMSGQASIQDAIAAYKTAVKNGTFPTTEHSFE